MLTTEQTPSLTVEFKSSTDGHQSEDNVVDDYEYEGVDEGKVDESNIYIDEDDIEDDCGEVYEALLRHPELRESLLQYPEVHEVLNCDSR